MYVVRAFKLSTESRGEQNFKLFCYLPDKAICITSAAKALEGRKYEYVEDPLIEFAESGNTAARKFPKGIPSGGINVTVVGLNFNFIQDPTMYIVYQEKR